MQQDLKEIFGDTTGLDNKSIESLTNALEKNNLPGFDYLEFKLSLGKLAVMNLPEEMAYKSAFATASTVGLTKEKLLTTGQHYRKVLFDEKEQFNIALQGQLQKRVNNKQEEVAKLKAQIQAWQEQIVNLQNQIAKSQATIDDAGNQIEAEMKKIQSTKDSFEYTHQSIMNQLELDLQNIQRYL
jgi:chromosome segregation ATPase